MDMIESLVVAPVRFAFTTGQWVVDKALSPNPPPSDGGAQGRPRLAIIGAGITGVTAAAHCVGHGFDVVLFEAGSRDNLGGIWHRVNESSSLQVHAATYRFHPSVRWTTNYPNKSSILEQVEQLWHRYKLEPRTVFNTCVKRVARADDGRWIVNNEDAHGRFDGVIAAVGTCGKPKKPSFDGADNFRGEVYHSSELTGTDPGGKRVAIIGGGASAIEALEHAVAKGATSISILSRSDKWIIPRNVFVDVLLSLNIFGSETHLSWIPETLLRKLFYRDLAGISPQGRDLFTDTPMVNSEVLEWIREGRADWVRCEIENFEQGGVGVSRKIDETRQQHGSSPKTNGETRKRELIKADMVVLATGFARPSLEFLPSRCFEEPYDPPNWYLQVFPPPHPSVSAINCTYVAGIGAVGNWHIGIYTRILLMFLCDPLTRPGPTWMRAWVQMTRLLKSGAPTAAFAFFTYLELIWWFAFCLLFNPFRWKWAVFVLFGVGLRVPEKIVRTERSLVGRTENGKDEGWSF